VAKKKESTRENGCLIGSLIALVCRITQTCHTSERLFFPRNLSTN